LHGVLASFVIHFQRKGPPVAADVSARRGKSWSSGVRLRRWSAAAALALAFGTAAFVVSDGGSRGVKSGSGTPSGETNSTPMVAVQSQTPKVNGDHAPTAPVELTAGNGGLHRATADEQRAWRPAQAFSLQSMDGTSSGGAYVARDRHLR